MPRNNGNNGPPDDPGTTPFAAPLDIRFVHSLEGSYRFSERPTGGRGAQVFSGRTISISPVTIQITGPVIGEPGERVVAVFPHLGEIPGLVARAGRTSFDVSPSLSQAERARLAATINWLKRRHVRAAANLRGSRRIRLAGARTSFRVDGDEAVPCTLIDMSETGAAVATDAPPPVGASVTVGDVAGTVQRHLPGGFAVRFAEKQPLESLRARLTEGSDHEPGSDS